MKKSKKLYLKKKNKIVYICGNPSPYDSNQEFSEGKKIFKINCQSCHLPDKKMTGPALSPIMDSISNEELLFWVKDKDRLKKATNDGKITCSIFSSLDSTDIINLKEYLTTTLY